MEASSKKGLDLYRRLRFQEQYTWYRDRSDEYETAKRQARLLTALLLLVSATAAPMAAADIGGHHRVWAITVAAAAAGSAAVTSYAAVYQFDTLASSYRRTMDALGSLAPDEPGLDGLAGDIGAYINSTERVLLDEVEGWTRATRSPIQEGSQPETSGATEES
jgi:hypothetical protein